MGEIMSTDGMPVRHRHWDAQRPKAALVILPGMAEHTLRYERFANALAARGISVLAAEARGHGEGAQKLGWFAKKDGWKAVVQDARAALAHMRQRCPGVPVVLLGHSMGSVFARALLMQKQEPAPAGCILLGVTVDKPARRSFAPAIAKLTGFFTGRDKPSRFLTNLLFGAFNKAFAPNRTAFDWISRDEAEVDKYAADPLCGFDCTSAMFVDMAQALLFTLKRENEARIGVPVLIAVGSRDPVGGPKAARFLQRRWRALGKDVVVNVYPGARHELLNETNRDEVTRDLADFVLRFARK